MAEDKGIPLTEEQITQMSKEDKDKILKTLMGSFSEDELKANEKISKLLKSENTPEPKPEPKKDTPQPTSEAEQLAQTMMADYEERVENIYPDAKSLIETLNSIPELSVYQKATLMSKVVTRAAKMLRDQKNTLKSEMSGEEGEKKTETQLSAPKGEGKENGESFLKNITSEMALQDKELEAIGLKKSEGE